MLLIRARLLQFSFACLLLAFCASGSFAQAIGIVGANAGAGVIISPEGVLKRAKLDPTGALARKRFLAARAEAKDSSRGELRKVSLNRLEAAVKEHMATGELMTEEMRFLAGLTRIEYVFYLPESNDIVIAGPAEPWFISSEGEPHGVDSLRPTVRLDDLVVALRSFAPHLPLDASTTIGCSIDPTKEGLANMQKFLSTVGSRAKNVNYLVNSLRKAMGMQNVTIRGVSDKSHFAVVMVAADYRMKLIGIGVEKPPVKISSYVDYARPSRKRNALVRWYFKPDYKCVRMTEDGMAMQLVGDSVKLVGADEVVGADGVRHAGGKADAASKKFVQGFTKKYPELAKKVPVYAQLRQLIDLSVVAAFIRQQDFYGKSGWMMDFFGSEETFPICDYNSPKQIETVVTAVWKGNTLMTPLGGGVVMRPTKALAKNMLLPDEGGKVANRHQQINVKDLPQGKWWWD